MERSVSSSTSGTSASRNLVGSLVERLKDDTQAVEAAVSDGETLLAYVSLSGGPSGELERVATTCPQPQDSSKSVSGRNDATGSSVSRDWNGQKQSRGYD